MLKISDTKNGEIFVRIQADTLDKTAGDNILRELPRFFGKGKIIVLDLEQVDELTSDGFGRLYDLMKDAGKAQTFIRFTNVNDSYSEKIHTLTTTSES